MPKVDGYKTYFAGILYIISVIASYYYPDFEWDKIQGVIAGFGVLTIRHAIKQIDPKNQPQPTKEEESKNV
jgi:hypothetical protein